MLAEPIPQDTPALRTSVPEEYRGFNRDGNSLNVQGHYVDTIALNFSLPKVTEENPAAPTIYKLLANFEENEGLEEIVWRLLIQDPKGKYVPKKVLAAAISTLIQHEQHRKGTPWLPKILLKSPPLNEPTREHTNLIAKASATWGQHGRSVCVTYNGRILLGPAEAKPGDKISVVGGAISPLVLRESGGTYTLVGDLHVFGLVDELSEDSMVWDMKKLVIV